ncbi:MAG: cell division ATP-binding protein FtsE [Deltaproteobacteria bacterium]|nr:cell division ATP-binding protein FtsE [Deltaproteobacteria bacterium]
MIELFGISKTYKDRIHALEDITLKIDRGEFVFITGPSGAGKTTLLKIIFGTEPPTDGQMIIDGKNYFKIPPRELPFHRRRVGFIFQDFKLLFDRTVFENVALSLRINGQGFDEIQKRVIKTLSYVRLQHRANFRPDALSAGEQQRVSIARAFVKEPLILLADEPTGNLDPELSYEIMDLFKDANVRGATVVVATHNRTLIERMDKRAIVLKDGRVKRADGTSA